ncbi:MAG: chorismate lyase [Neisseriaceae bacterium]|nr:chorismate lyase [Neisseriaceae bacterium]MBR5940131.1 chorismate lyase [Neisseriaceae bacterium]
MTLNDFIYAPSLTAVLKQNRAAFSVRPTFADTTEILPEEMPIFPDISTVFAREVLLCLDTTPVVAARSICLPNDTYWREILNCGTQSLGARLFDGKTQWLRSDFSVVYQHSLLKQRFRLPENTMIALRTSLFQHENRKLLLAECFLPALKNFGFE